MTKVCICWFTHYFLSVGFSLRIGVRSVGICSTVWSNLGWRRTCVQKLACKCTAIGEIIAATAPSPGLACLDLVVGFSAVTFTEPSGCTCPCDSMSNTSRWKGVKRSRLLVCLTKETRNTSFKKLFPRFDHEKYAYLSWAWAYASGRVVSSSIVRARTAADTCRRTCGWLFFKNKYFQN